MHTCEQQNDSCCKMIGKMIVVVKPLHENTYDCSDGSLSFLFKISKPQDLFRQSRLGKSQRNSVGGTCSLFDNGESV